MLDKEPLYMVDPDYLKNVQKDEIKDVSRVMLIDWLIDVHRKFKLLPETLYCTVQTIDRYLAKVTIKKTQLQMLGVTALLIATKYEEIYPPELKQLMGLQEVSFTKKDVLNLEFDILKTLEFNYFGPSPYRFLERYSTISDTGVDSQIFFLAQYIQELTLLDPFFLKHKPSRLAAASFIIAAHSLKKPNIWKAEMEKLTGIKKQDLKEVIEDI